MIQGIVDVMITVAPNFFYTVVLPVTLWFFDKAKTEPEHPRHDQTLFIDARKIFNQVSRSQREFTQAQLLNIASIVWLYRGETEKFKQLRELYEQAKELWTSGEVRSNDGADKTYRGIAAHRETLAAAFRALADNLKTWHDSLPSSYGKADGLFGEQSENGSADLPEEKTATTGGAFRDVEEWKLRIKNLQTIAADDLTDKAAIAEKFKFAEKAASYADKVLRPEKDKTFARADIRPALKRLADERDDALFVLECIAYFAAQGEWLNRNFPEGVWRDVEGLCKIAGRAEIAEQNFSLNPGRYVGVSMEDDGMTEEDFREFMHERGDSLRHLHAEAVELQSAIAEDLTALFSEAKAEAV